MSRPPADLAEVRPILVTRQQAAVMLAVSPSRVYRLEAEHGLKPIKFAGKSGVTYYRLSDLQDLVAALAGASND